MKTTGEPAKLTLTAEKKIIKVAAKELAFITVAVVDHNGLVVPRTHNLINFKIKGPGKIVAIGNGNAASHESFQGNSHHVYNGLAVVYLKAAAPGKIVLIASASGLKGTSLQLNAK